MSVALWSSDAWLADAAEWLDERLAEAAIPRTGSVEQTHLRPWATVLRAPTARGPVWLKACARDTAFEAGLYELLRRVVPDHVLEPLAVDAARGWLLLPDGGPSLGERMEGAALTEALEWILPAYGALQRELAPHAGGMLALGVPDMRPARMPERFEEALDAMQDYVERAGSTASALAAYERLEGLRGTVTRWCEELAAAPGPPSLDHNDLHPWNILAGDGRTRFYDWGDSVVAHPFASMLVALGVAQSLVGPGAPRLRDAYLEAFGDLAPHGELVAALELACRVGKIARALTWHRAIGAGGPDEVEERWIMAPIESMVSLLDDSHLGRA